MIISDSTKAMVAMGKAFLQPSFDTVDAVHTTVKTFASWTTDSDGTYLGYKGFNFISDNTRCQLRQDEGGMVGYVRIPDIKRQPLGIQGFSSRLRLPSLSPRQGINYLKDEREIHRKYISRRASRME